MSIREAALPLANDGVDDIFSQAASETASFAPSFREAWRPLFAEDRYQHMLPAIHVFCWVPAFYFLCSFSWRCHSGLHYRESAKEFAKERSVWLATLLSDMAKTLACSFAGIIFVLPSLRLFCVRNVDWLCAALVAFLYAAEFLAQFHPVWEDLKARGLLTDCAAAVSTGNLGMCREYSSILTSDAFNNDFVLKCIFFCHLPLVLRMRANQMWVVTGAVLVSNVAALFAVGQADWGLLANLVLQLAMIIPCTILMRREETRAEQNFAYIMTIRFASEVHKHLLHTLIPPNVLKFITGAGEAGPNKALPSAQEIPFCTVMFASVNYDVTTPDDFDFLNHLFSAFDQAVEHSGMFKYQHVSSGACHYFIVTCPCVSNPYQDAGADSYAHSKNYLDMIALGFDIMKITEKISSLNNKFGQDYRQSEMPARTWDVHVKIGICSGPAAGVVLGRCRRFYCVYGDTINTAARMCASSPQEAVRVTAEIGEHPSVKQSSWFASEQLQKVPIKGKGDMDVCDLRIKSESFFSRKSPEREAVILRRRVTDDNVHDEAEPATLRGVLHMSGSLERMASESAPQSGARLLHDIQQLRSSVGPKGPMPLETFKPKFCSSKHEQAFQNSNRQNLKLMESLHGGFIFQFGILFLLCFYATGLCGALVGGSRCSATDQEKCLPESQARDSFVQKVVWMMTAFVAVSYCLVLCIAGSAHRCLQILQDAAISYNLMVDTSVWCFTDEKYEAHDLMRVPRLKMSHSRAQLCKNILCLCKLVCCYASILVGLMVPCRRDFLLGLAIGQLQTFGLYGVDFGGTLALAVAGIPGYLFVFSLGQQSNMFARYLGFNIEIPTYDIITDDPTFYFRNVCAIAIDLLWAASVWRSERTTWGIDMDYRDRLCQMRTVLLDLLPSTYLNRLIQGCDYIECSSGRAVVLQLDICNFTLLSQQHESKKIADIVNALICDFDDCVLGSIGHMIKVDTIGDAYIVVDWLAPGDLGNLSQDNQHNICNLCLYLDTLIVANNILAVLARCREEKGIDVHARIGIGTGEVISGVMGRLQPRFCVYGEAMNEAAENERQGLADTVHCSQDFFDVVTRDLCSDHCIVGIEHKIDGIRLVDRMVQEGNLKVCRHSTELTQSF